MGAVIRRCFFWGACLFGELVQAAAAGRPNVVVFLADDAGWGDYSASGNEALRTPHIDSLSRDGVSLDRFFVQPVCSPTRAEFLTGRYHPRAGVRGVSTGQERMDLAEKTLADAFKAAGYATGAFGKWHNGSQWPYHPQARGFDEYFGYTSGHWGEYFDPPLERNGVMERAKGYVVDVCTNEALAFIERNRSRPFLCYIPFTTPHSPWAVPEEYWRRFKDKRVSQRGSRPGGQDLDETRCALAMMENQDWNVGRVLRKLDELQLAENTLVIYFSDNGPNGFRWNGGMKGRKGTVDEGGVRSVCFMRWPAKLPKGRAVGEIAGAIDLLPTITALAGVQRAGALPLDGLDLSPLLSGDAGDWPDRMLFATWSGKTSVRTQQYRMVAGGGLFDMREDPAQTRDLTAERPGVASRLAEAVAAWHRDVAGGEPKPAPGRATDPRPIPVGFPEFPITRLPARDGEPKGGIERSASAPNSSYFVKWANTSGRMVWNLDVRTGGAGESRMKEFRPLKLGVMRIEKGPGPLTLRALRIPGKSVMEVRSVTLTLLNGD
jgi:arylsulfatase A-like enzyme